MVFSAQFHAELCAIQFIFRGNFLNPNSFISCSNLRQLWDYKKREIEHESKKRCPQSGFNTVINSANLFPISR